MIGWDALSLSFALVWAQQGAREAIPVRIEFRAPPACSSRDAFYAGVRARTERVREATGSERALQLRIELVVRGGRVRGELASIDQQGATQTRTVDGSTCDEVVEALSLTAALAIDPDARFTRADSPEPAPPASPASAASSEPEKQPSEPEKQPASSAAPSKSAPKPTPPTRGAPDSPKRGTDTPRFHFEAGVQLAGSSLLRSDAGVGASLFARLSQPGSGVRASFGVTLAHLRNDIFGPSVNADVHWTGVVLSACPLRASPSTGLGIRACAFGSGGWLSATGLELQTAETRGRSWWSVGPLARAEAAIGQNAGMELELGLGVPLVRRRFVTTDPDRFVGETPNVAPFAALGAGYRF